MLTMPLLEKDTTLADVALVCSDGETFGTLTRLLRRAMGRVYIAGSLKGLDHQQDCVLVAVNYDDLTRREQLQLAERFTIDAEGGPTLLLLSKFVEESELAELFAKHALTNLLIVGDAGIDMADLLVTLQKIRRGVVFGLDKYFVWGVEPKTVSVRCSRSKALAVEQIDAYAAELGIARRLRGALRTVADEFLSNALYNAPVDAEGVHRYASQSRTLPVELEPGETIDVRFCCDGRRFGLSVTDPFGSLDPRNLQDHLARGLAKGVDQVSTTPGGAGLGFYQILTSLSHFVVNLEPRVQTEMIAILDVRGGWRKFVESGKSFNLFVQQGA